MIYNNKIRASVVRLFGKESEIYTAMMNGEKISILIKESYNRIDARKIRVREKRMLLKECEEIESFLYENYKSAMKKIHAFYILSSEPSN